MTATNADLLRKKKSLYISELTSGIDDSESTIPLISTLGLPTDTAITLTIDRVDSNGLRTPLKMERVTGIVSGQNLITSLRGRDNTLAQAHDAGAVVEDIWDGSTWNNTVDWGLVQHNQDGTHKPNILDFNPAGVYDAGVDYLINDIVTYNGGSYIAISATTGNLPTDTDYWFQISASGDDGTLWYSGTAVPDNGDGVNGDFYFRTTTNDIYKKVTGTWGIIANTTGPQGATGNTGPQGDAGKEIELQEGATYIQWRYVGDVSWQNLILIADLVGATGAQGNPGTNGTNGTDGATWRSGTTVPDNGVGVDGDFYFRTTTNDIYKRISGTYSIIANTTGTKGDKGDTGATGAGVPAGGAANKVLKKKSSTDYDTEWGDEVSVPVKATSSENVIGTDDTKFLTALANVPAFNNSLSRQAIINGNFDVWQRGTSVTGAANGSFLADRWNYQIAADGGTLPTLVQSRQILTSGDVPGSFFHWRLAPNGAGTSLGNGSLQLIGQRIENGNRFLCGNGKKVTLSFYARASVANKRLGLSLVQNYGSGGSPSGEEIITGEIITLTSSWVKYTKTFTTNTLAGKTFGTTNDDFLFPLIFTQWGTTIATSFFGGGTAETYGGSGTIDIAQVQLCAGDVALPFMPKSFEEELRACQRYYWRLVGGSTYSCFGVGMSYSTTSSQIFINFPVQMRIPPSSIETTGNFCLYNKTPAIEAVNATITVTSGTSSVRNIVLTAPVAGNLTIGLATQLMANNDTTASIAFSAEL